MGFFLPIVAAVLQAASLTVDKTVLSLKHVTYKTYTGISYPLLFVIGSLIYICVRPPFDTVALVNHNLLFLLLSVAIAIGTNLFYYRALKEDSIGEIQTWTLLAAFPTILLASAVFKNERQLVIIAAALVAGAAILWSHYRKGHFRIAKKTIPFLFWALAIYPLGSLLNKELLAVWNPITLELARDTAVGLVLAPLFWRQSVKVSGKAFKLLVITNILTAGAFLLNGYSIQRSGIIFTGLLYSLQPLLAYFSSVVFLKERFDRKKTIALLVVLASIVVVRIFG